LRFSSAVELQGSRLLFCSAGMTPVARRCGRRLDGELMVAIPTTLPSGEAVPVLRLGTYQLGEDYLGC